MLKITTKLGIAMKVLLFAMLMTGLTTNSFSQKKSKKEKVIERPSSIGDSNVDAFVTSSFDIYEQNQEISKQLSDAKGNAGKTKQMTEDLKTQTKDITSLLGKSKDIIKGAKTMTPKSNSIKAVGALNKAVKALNATQSAIPGQLEQIKSQKE